MTSSAQRAAPPAGQSAPVRAPAPSRARVYLALAVGILCVGFSPIFTRWSEVPGTVSAAYRMFIAGIVLALPFAADVRRGKVERDRRLWLGAALAGVFLALDLGIWNTSLFMTSAATATLLDNDAPIFVGLGALLLFHERLGRSYWIGLAVALAGMLIISGQALGARGSVGAGDLLAAFAGVFYALFLLATQRVRARLGALSSLWLGVVGGGIVLLLFNLAAHHPLWGFSPHAYLALLALGLVTQVFGWLAINYVLGNLSAPIVAATLLAQPVVSAVLAVPLLGEPLGAAQISGGLVALVGIYLVNRGAGA